MNKHELLIFSGFIVFICAMLALDLGVFNRKTQIVKTKNALIWTSVWIAISILFYVVLFNFGEKLHGISSFEELKFIVSDYEHECEIIPGDYLKSLHNYRSVLAMEFITGYLIELSLSVDNIFVIILIFNSFYIERQYYHRVLFWGILGAIVFRCLFIFLGAYLISNFSWILNVFAVFLIFTGIKMFLDRNATNVFNSEDHPITKFVNRFWAVYTKSTGSFFLVVERVRYVTPLFIVLLIIEFTDLVFAVDSIPAIFAITRDPYIVFFSNIFAILGLRSMFFVLSSAMQKFRFIKTGLSVLLVFIGLKMLFHDWLKEMGFSIGYSLLVIVVILAITIVASLIFPEKKNMIEKQDNEPI